MEHNQNNLAPEASTDERASPSHAGADSLAFEPVALRYRCDGWTPQRQREFVEALAETGVIRDAAARVEMTEQSVNRLRRRAEARAFDLVCDAAQRIGARRLLSVGIQRAIEGSVRRRYWHGEVVGEERVYDNKLLMFLIGKLGETLAPRAEIADVESRWETWLEAIEAGGPPPERAAAAPAAPGRKEEEEEDGDGFDGSEVTQDSDGSW